MNVGWKLRLLRALGHQHWLVRGRDRLIRRFCHPDTMRPVGFEVDFFGLRYPGSLDNFVDWSVFFYGAYAANELLLLRDLARSLRPRAAALNFADIGANVGQHSLFMSALADHVYAFEPLAAVRTKLEEKIARNRLSNVTVFPVALGAADEERDFYPPAGANQGVGTFVRPAVPPAPATRLPVRHGDRFLAEMGVPALHIVKIDVEGFEPEVLRGLAGTLRRDRPAILLEISEAARRAFGSERAFRAHLYDGHAIFGLGARGISGSYRLRDFDYAASGEALVVADELRPVLSGLLPAA